MNQLGYKRRCLCEHSETNQHLQSEEETAFIARMEDRTKNETNCNDSVPLEVYFLCFPVQEVFVLVALVN